MRLNQLKYFRDYWLVRNSNLFDKEYYLAQNPDIARLNLDPIKHYLERGWLEDRNPSERFNTREYLLANKDVEQSGINPLVHYLRFGRVEGRYLKTFGVQVKNPRDKDFCDLLSFFHAEPVEIQSTIPCQVDILILVNDRPDLIKATLNNLIRNTRGPFRLLIVNDHSGDPEVTYFLTGFKETNANLDITIVTNEQKLGFAKTINRLVEQTLNHFVILRSGTFVPPDWLPRLMFPIHSNQNIASTTPFSNTNSICGFPGILTDNAPFMDLEVEKIDSYFRRVDYERNLTVIPSGVGFCMGINRDVFTRTGMFRDDSGDGYTAVNEWCTRASNYGFSHLLAPNLFVECESGSPHGTQKNEIPSTEELPIESIKTPNYDLLIKDFRDHDPLAELRKLMMMAIYAGEGHSQLVLDHAWGGGANEYTRQLTEKSDLTLIIAPDDEAGDYQVILVMKNKDTESYRLKDELSIRQIVETLGVRKIVLNELVSFPHTLNLIKFLLELKSSISGLDYSFITHDYFGVCPSLNLLNQKGKFCNIPEDLNICEACLKENPLAGKQVHHLLEHYPGGMMAAWRSGFMDLLSACSSIICFSNSSRELLLKAYPGLGTLINVEPHQVGWVRRVNIKKTSKRINIAIIGTLTKIKGAEVVVSLGRYLKENHLKHHIHIFGPVVEPYNAQLAGLDTVTRHFAYVKSELPGLMEANQIDIVFISSICPETFSYTTQETIEMGLPVASFDLGAPAERVKTYPNGLILKDDIPQNMINSINRFLLSLKTEQKNR